MQSNDTNASVYDLVPGRPKIRNRLSDPMDFTLYKPDYLHSNLQSFYCTHQLEPDLDMPLGHDKLPQWVTSYLQWHRKIRPEINSPESIEKGYRFLVLSCLETWGKCGGLADRLKPIPLALRLAYETKRVLLVYWNKPCELEEFLEPARGGLDWRTPTWIHSAIVNGSMGINPMGYQETEGASRTNFTVIMMSIQDFSVVNINTTLACSKESPLSDVFFTISGR